VEVRVWGLMRMSVAVKTASNAVVNDEVRTSSNS
jgi:hypothetical protein